MKILTVNTYDKGGAANACLRLHKGLLQENIDNQVIVLHLSGKSKKKVYQFDDKEHIFPQLPTLTWKNWLDEKINKTHQKAIKHFLDYSTKEREQQNFIESRTKGLELFSFPSSNYDITKSKFYKEADIINLHWTTYFLDWESFFRNNTKPIVWTLHDQNSFLGGEHYQEIYLGISESGEPIERNLTQLEIQKHKEILDYKKKILNNVKNIHIVTPSQWLTASAKESNVFQKASFQTIPYGLDTTVFKPRPKNLAREFFAIDNNTPMILFVAESITNQRKGFDYLKRAIELVRKEYPMVQFCAVGELKDKELNKNNEIKELGYIRDELLLSAVYSAADVFVIPSLMDNLPNTVLESLCCGTPVIGFDIGGVPDMVENEVNGYLCNEISVNSLKETIEKFLENTKIFDTEKIAKEAQQKYSLSTQAKKYKNLFKQIMNNE